MTKAIIFDFDGTLVDTKSFVSECFEKVTKEVAPTRIGIAKKILIGPQLRESIKIILGEQFDEKVDIFVEKFITLHDKNILKKCYPFPMTTNVLEKLKQKKISMAVATNKRMRPTFKLINYLGWSKYFIFIECSDSEKINRNKIDMINKIIKNPIFNKAYYLGDTISDALSSKKCNLPFIRANYGYGKKEEWSKIDIFNSIDSIDQLLNL